MKISKLITFLLLCLSNSSFSQSSCEENLNKVREILSENSPFMNGELMFELVKPCAEGGDSKAESFLGMFYLNGVGTEKNDDLAFEYITLAANKNLAIAQYNLGRMYKYGVGCELDFEKAIEWFRKATKNGNQRAAYSLGYMYFKGFAVPQDYQKAVEWFQKSEDYMAQHYLGLCYYLGYGVEPNEEKALEILLNNPISNSEALISHIINNRKLEIEESINELIEEDNDIEKENQFNIEETAKISETNKLDDGITINDITGSWKGKFIQYDWSGKRIVRILPMEFTLKNKDSLNVSFSIEDKIIDLNPVWFEKNLLFENTSSFALEKLYSHDLDDLFLEYDMLALSFEKYTVYEQTYLVANLETYINEWKEYGRPSRIILKEKSNDVELDHKMLMALASQDNQFIKLYPVPFKDKIAIQYELATESNVHLELVSINGGSPIIVKSNELQKPGKYMYSVPVNQSLPFGIYVVKLFVANKLYTRTVIREK